MRDAILARLRQMTATVEAASAAAQPVPQATPSPTAGESRGDTPHITPHIRGGISSELTPHIPGLYRAWVADLLAGRDVLAIRAARLWLHQRVRMQRRVEISASSVDYLVKAFRRKAFQQGYLLLNPRYTGRAPHPQYVRAGGAA